MQQPIGWYRRFALLLSVLLLPGISAGCRSISHRTSWNPPAFAEPQSSLEGDDSCLQAPNLAMAESAYAEAFKREANGDATCVDYYYQTATLVWPDVASGLAVREVPCGRAADLYRSALTRLITTGQHFQRLDPGRGLSVQTTVGWLMVPTIYHGFAWRPEDFNQLVPVGDYETQKLNHSYASSGLGVATVAIHCRTPNESLRKEQQVFAATVILRPTNLVEAFPNSPFALELFDSLSISHVDVAGRSAPLQRDITAPIAYALKDQGRNYVEAFLRPGSTTNNTGLFMIEPYQPGKIPVVLVHGLLSDPYTWANVANEIRARPDLQQRYQMWGFEYPTGEPFLQSSAMLRSQLQDVQARMDPARVDLALRQMVLIGHSMGGLVSKLQVTHSQDMVWQAVSNCPLESIVTTPTTRNKLAKSFFFSPSRMVSRVIYVGTPHRGSPWARRPIGRFGSALVDEPSSMEAEHEQLIRDNPNAFSREFSRRIPTSIDLLRTDSPLLEAIDRLPVAGHVRQHSIIGSFRPLIGAGNSDGVVPVSSARQAGVVSEELIRSKHGLIHKNQQGIDELVRILRQHIIEFDSEQYRQVY